MNSLSRQRMILNYIEAFYSQHGFMPSFREIGDACGLNSASSVSYQIQKLIDAGKLSRAGVGQRALQLIKGEDK